MPAPPSNLYSSLAVFASLQSAFNTAQCHAASHKLKRDGELSLSFSVVKTCASRHAAGLLSHPESAQATANQSLSLCGYGGRCFFYHFTCVLLKRIECKQRGSQWPIQSLTLRFRSSHPTNSWLFPHKMEVVFMLFLAPLFFPHLLPSLSLQPPGFLCDESQLCQGHLSLR